MGRVGARRIPDCHPVVDFESGYGPSRGFLGRAARFSQKKAAHTGLSPRHGPLPSHGGGRRGKNIPEVPLHPLASPESSHITDPSTLIPALWTFPELCVFGDTSPSMRTGPQTRGQVPSPCNPPPQQLPLPQVVRLLTPCTCRSVALSLLNSILVPQAVTPMSPPQTQPLPSLCSPWLCSLSCPDKSFRERLFPKGTPAGRVPLWMMLSTDPGGGISPQFSLRAFSPPLTCAAAVVHDHPLDLVEVSHVLGGVAQAGARQVSGRGDGAVGALAGGLLVRALEAPLRLSRHPVQLGVFGAVLGKQLLRFDHDPDASCSKERCPPASAPGSWESEGSGDPTPTPRCPSATPNPQAVGSSQQPRGQWRISSCWP